MSDARVEAGTATDHRSLTAVFVDNFDSFTYNLVEYVSEHEHTHTHVVKNTASLSTIAAFEPDLIVISPGPGHPATPRDVGVTPEVLLELSPRIPTFGVCLGLEAAVQAYGGRVGHAPEPVHGKAFPIRHDGSIAFEGLEQGFAAGRYHSLIATDIPDVFSVTARTDHDGPDGLEELVMGIRHETHPIECVQFHPESVLTGVGHDVIDNVLGWARDYDAE